MSEALDEQNFWNVAFGSLLHDVGKYKFRVDLAEYDHDIETNIFLNQVPSNFGTVRSALYADKNATKKYDKFGKLIWLGDYLSSQERDFYIGNEKNTSVKSSPLINVFTRICKKEKPGWFLDSPLNFHDFKRLNLDSEQNFEFCDKNYKEFINSFKEIKLPEEFVEEDYKKTFLKAYKLYEKYVINVPGSAYVDNPISLFSHSKIASAISGCLFRLNLDESDVEGLYSDQNLFYLEIKDKEPSEIKSNIEKEKKKGEESALNQPYFLEINCDFSGIQDFIFDIGSDKALKNLKARSFFLSYLSNLLANKIIEETKLTPANIIFCSGGNFRILAHKSDEVKEKAEELANKFNEALYENFENKVFVAMSWRELSSLDFSRYNVDIDNKDDCRKISKQQKFLHLILNKENFFLKDYVQKPSLQEKFKDVYDILEEIQKKKKITQEYFKNLNEKFGLSSFRSFWFGENSLNINEFPNGSAFDLTSLGVCLGPEGKKIDLDSLAEKSKERGGAKYIGAVKLDIDDLGQLFTEGFEDGLKTYSRHAELSYRLKYFFEGYVSYLQQEESYEDFLRKKDEKFRENLDVIFSGGDDCFVVGAYDSVLHFLFRLKCDFEKYVNNKEIHFSAAFSVYPPTYPIYNIYEELEEKLSQAKSNDEKNRCYILNDIVKWKELSDLKEFSSKLYDLVIDQELRRSLCKRFADAVKDVDKISGDLNNSGMFNAQNLWRLQYFIAREFGKREEWKNRKGGEALECLVDKVANVISGALDGKELNSNFIKIASRLVEIHTKNLGNGGKNDVPKQ